MSKLAGVALLLTWAALALPNPASADANWKSNSAVWRAEDHCTQAAQKAYPDYTPESNAKREEARQSCLRGNNLPAATATQPTTSQATPQH